MNPTTNPVASNGATTSHTTAAQEHVDQLRAMRETIPNFTMPESATAGQRLAAVASLPPAFVELVAMALKNNPSLTQGGTDADTIRDLMTFAGAYEPVADEFEAMAHFLRHSITAARHEAGTAALMAYEVAKRLAKKPANAGLADYVADMSEALGFRGRAAKAEATKKRKAQPVATPAPAVTPSSKP